MKTTIKKEDNHLTAFLDGELDTIAATETQNELTPLFEAHDCELTIDCSGLKYISSSGLRLLLSLLKTAKANGSTLTLHNINDDILNVFKMTGFTSLFNIV